MKFKTGVPKTLSSNALSPNTLQPNDTSNTKLFSGNGQLEVSHISKRRNIKNIYHFRQAQLFFMFHTFILILAFSVFQMMRLTMAYDDLLIFLLHLKGNFKI